jgi:DNA polymerase III epsilon subunit-like protein
MILVFDTETSNLPQRNLPLDHHAQARIVQFGVLLLDEQFNERASFCSLIKPDGWIIQPGAQAAHGITQEQCQKYGIAIESALRLFEALRARAFCITAHNISFDNELLNTERTLQNVSSPDFVDGEYCTMHLMTPICKLPKRNGGDYKWPKLQEAYKHVTGKEFEGAHGALADCKATATIFKWLVDNKHVSIPQLVLA